MSLVGTRPILQDELLKYELHHRARIAIKPGITGMWQVSGRSDITDFEEVVRLDTEYISKYAIVLVPNSFIGYAKTAVGDKYVYEYMAKNGCRIGGEQSGHIIFSKYASTGDGILTSLKMMEVMLAKKKPMSELAAPLKIYPQVLENVRVTDKKAAQNDPAVQEAVSRVAEALGDTGRILVRESGTEPVVRVMVEAPDHDICQKYVDEVVHVICEKGYKA